MSEKPSASAAGEPPATAPSSASASNARSNGSSSTAAPKGTANQGNPAFRMMGLPRLRLPSRNWLIFLSITGSFASAVIYDKYQTRRVREKWCNLVSHIPNEHLDPKSLPRRVTIYLAAPPGDGLRTAREHFHNYVKPVLVAAAMDWDVVEGRKEGDVRYKTAERIRKRRKKNGEGEPMSQEEVENLSLVDAMRERNGTHEFDGVAGDLVIGRNTWKEYVRGLHEGWLGPADAPKQPEPEEGSDVQTANHVPGVPSLGDAAVKAAGNMASQQGAESAPSEATPESQTTDDASPAADAKQEEETKEEEEKPKPRQPPPYIQPTAYPSASLSKSTPETLGPSIGIQFPHILGFRNTPIRIYRFLTRRHLADSICQDVAAAVLASHGSYSTSLAASDDDSTPGAPEQSKVLQHEESNWWKTTFQPRKEHEESVWIEEIVLDDRIASRMRAFQLTAEDEDRAKRIADGREKVPTREDEEA
ncbi:mitochondrial import inner membrane translocase subunit tim54 [Saxophila tyrrhenica]|uniref:Mitochondrial import inner membrane translocase subunit TIM54 n=1 Tax=Saxophila tyrrhenica TaxID=1690608 RepID=A0AAV9P8V5_9PEZI|nr:mitochondrial import inner membrane translocase subunit tim54 [Saxophila tyrrhenica]